MKDIVDILLEVTPQTLTSECYRAADEIKRLRNVLVSLRSAGGWVRDVIDLELKESDDETDQQETG